MGAIAEKIIGIFTESAVDAAFDEAKLSDCEKLDKAIKTIKNVLGYAKEAVNAKIEATPLNNILDNYNREKAISLIDKYARKYEHFINGTTFMTGYKVVYSENPYADKTDEFIESHIMFTIYIVYLAALVENGTKALVTKAFKGIINIFKSDNTPTMDEEKLIKRMETIIKKR